MKTRQIIILFLSSIICICSITSCSEKIIYDKIYFGKGGGFTGKYDEFFIAKNGNIYKKDPATKAFSKIKDVSKKEIVDIFKEINNNKLFELGFNSPYNISCYLEISKGTVSNRIVWGNPKTPPPAAVVTVFNKLMGMVNINKNNNMKVQKK